MALFDSPVSGMDSFQQMLDVIGNNVANSNTVGYKTSEVNFSDILSQTIASGAAGSAAGTGGTNPQQVGLGVKIGAINPVFTQGSLSQTSNPTDLALNGSGFFVVSPSQSGTPAYYTRAGNFQVDSNGNLVTSNGYYVLAMGPYTTAPALPPTATASTTLTNVKPININISGKPAEYTIGQDGKVTVSNGTTSNTYYIPIANFPNPDGLEKVGNNIFQAPSGGNTGAATYGQPGTANFGSVQQGFLESSNVDLTKELSNMLIAQTGYGSNSKVIQTQNQMFQSLLQYV